LQTEKTFWGGAIGKTVAALIVTGLVCAVLAGALVYSLYTEKLLDIKEIELNDAVHDGRGNVTVKFSLKKDGYMLSDFKTVRDGNVVKLRLYASIGGDKDYTAKTGVYTIVVNVGTDKSVTEIIQEANDGENSLVRLDWTD